MIPDSIDISNFKAFGAGSQKIPLKPITLLFGPNSAGKSSVLHSLLWLASVSKTGDLDVRHPEISVGSVDLGGFRQLTHRNDPDNKVRCQFTVSAGKLTANLPVLLGISQNFTYEISCGVMTNSAQIRDRVDELATEKFGPYVSPATSQDDDDWTSFFDHASRRIYEEMLLQKGRYQYFKGDTAPYIHTVSIGVDDREILRATSRKPGNLLITILDIDFIKALASSGSSSLFFVDTASEFLEWTVSKGLLCLGNQDLALPTDLVFSSEIKDTWNTWQNQSTDRPAGNRGLETANILLGRLSSALREIIHQAGYSMTSMAYIPPLRELPARIGALDESKPGSPWRELRTNDEVRKRVNEWLASDFLKSRYEFVTDAKVSLQILRETLLKEIEELVVLKRGQFEEGAQEWYDDEIEDPYEALGKPFADWDGEAEGKRLYEEIKTRTAPGATAEIALFDKRAGIQVSLRDVGVGISQVLPVLVESYANREKLIAIEQPEIHIHPALQAELGDVFIESALGENRNTFLLETHSEHLILRLLRRIRETTEGDFSTWSDNLKQACPNGIRTEDIAVLYVQPGEEGAEIIDLPVTEDGDFSRPWPEGFFTERAIELY